MVSRGSQWRRWEPHIHTPGTILNDQFGGTSAWDTYISKLETITPTIEAIAVTDYYVTDSYERLQRYKAEGRLSNIHLIFPNIELRLDVAAKSGFVNIHLLVCPDDLDHLVQLRRILSRLKFQAHGDRFDCTRDELIRLGKRADPSISDDRAALVHGATQFKVNFTDLKEVIHQSDWAKKNILIAVAGGSSDGTSGLRQAADATIRQEIEKFAHIIFSSTPAQRDFWLGHHVVSKEILEERYNGCKPCLQGSDSHTLETVGRPANDRFTWIKGALEFDSLRQACIDPEGRAFVGPEPPQSAMPSQVVSNASVTGASWAKTPEIPLNPGLVAIIGARGSGKTALADMIAAGCDAIPDSSWDASVKSTPSFLARARQHIGNAEVNLTWGGGTKTTRALAGVRIDSQFTYPRARYLSQQFVEELCSSSGVSDGLLNEIERVVLESHPIDEREGAIDFDEFRALKTHRFRQARERAEDLISALSDQISTEFEKERMVAILTKQVEEKILLIKNYKSDLSKLVVKGMESLIKRHTELSEAAQALRIKIQNLTSQRRTFIAMQDEVANTRDMLAPELLRKSREKHNLSGLNDKQWEDFRLIYKGDVDSCLSDCLATTDKRIAEYSGEPITQIEPNTPLIPRNASLDKLSLSILTAEIDRIGTLLNADKLIQKQYAELSKRIAIEHSHLKTLEDKLSDARGAQTRRKDLQNSRDNAYGQVFEAIINEQMSLSDLYAPLMSRLASATGTLKCLSFSVKRAVDYRKWGAYAEENLLDRRKAGPFFGRDTFIKLVEENLKPAWELGSAADVRAAMTNFITKFQKDILSHAPYSPTQQIEFKSWSKQFASWLFGTNHISVRYNIIYDGVDVRNLSPGTRGIVLLLLYLALDDSDDRPLIIDQPEENLDPKSVHDELVPLFIAAKSKRQVIIVTHNANLVINTDADQIIVAKAGPHPTGGLPPITYQAGGLEEISIRKAVCEILEGGETAFQERARRLRVRLDR